MKILLIMSLSLFLLCAGLYAYHVGEIIKTNNISLAERFTSSQSLTFLHWFFQQRFSTTLYGHTYLMNNITFSLSENWSNFWIAGENLFYRLDVLGGKMFGMEKPDYATLNQLHYDTLLITGKNETSGASPGLIPTFLYILPKWLGVLVAGLVFSIYMNLINLVLPKATFFFCSITILLQLDLFKAFGEAFNPVSTTFVQLLFFIGIVGYLHKVH